MSYPKEILNKEIHFNHQKPWTREDLEYLIKYYNFDTNNDLEYALGRTKKSISTMYWYLKKKQQM